MNKRLIFREATTSDLPLIVQMLADDPLGQQRESYTQPLSEAYHAAFNSIVGDPNNQLIVVTLGLQLAGVLQLTLIPSITYQGSWRAQIEGVRIAADYRSQGIGRALLQWAIERARSQGCRLIQLTTDRRRPAAIGFYEELGFEASHYGMKLKLE